MAYIASIVDYVKLAYTLPVINIPNCKAFCCWITMWLSLIGLLLQRLHRPPQRVLGSCKQPAAIPCHSTNLRSLHLQTLLNILPHENSRHVPDLPGGIRLRPHPIHSFINLISSPCIPVLIRNLTNIS